MIRVRRLPRCTCASLICTPQGLVRSCNAYINAPASQGAPRVLLVQGAARYVARILLIMGCSWGGEASEADSNDTANREVVLAPALDALLSFR